jgi:hypothetical protein
MSARRVETTSSLNHNHHHQVTVEARQTRLSLSPNSFVIHRNGIEFRSTEPISSWTEMTVTLQSPRETNKLHCTGVVISCSGNRHVGYHISMVFTSLSKQAQERLSSMAYTEAR